MDAVRQRIAVRTGLSDGAAGNFLRGLCWTLPSRRRNPEPCRDRLVRLDWNRKKTRPSWRRRPDALWPGVPRALASGSIQSVLVLDFQLRAPIRRHREFRRRPPIPEDGAARRYRTLLAAMASRGRGLDRLPLEQSDPLTRSLHGSFSRVFRSRGLPRLLFPSALFRPDAACPRSADWSGRRVSDAATPRGMGPWRPDSRFRADMHDRCAAAANIPVRDGRSDRVPLRLWIQPVPRGNSRCRLH